MRKGFALPLVLMVIVMLVGTAGVIAYFQFNIKPVPPFSQTITQPSPSVTQAALPTQGGIKINPDLELAVNLAKEDLAKRLRIPTSEIQVGEQIEYRWSDSSLGCPKEGVVYTQTVTTGYEIILDYPGYTDKSPVPNPATYRAAYNQKPFLCEGRLKVDKSGWKVYTRKTSNYSYSIEYPSEWLWRERVPDGSYSYTEFLELEISSGRCGGMTIEVLKPNAPGQSTLETEKAKTVKVGPEQVPLERTPGRTGSDQYFAKVIKGDHSFNFQFGCPQPSTGPDVNLELMLSTFKFTN